MNVCDDDDDDDDHDDGIDLRVLQVVCRQSARGLGLELASSDLR